MDPKTLLELVIQGGLGAVLLYLYLKQADSLNELRNELNEVRKAQWDLIVELVGEKKAHAISTPPNNVERKFER